MHTVYGDGDAVRDSIAHITLVNREHSPENYSQLRDHFLDSNGKVGNAAIAAYDLYLSLMDMADEKREWGNKLGRRVPLQDFLLDQLTGIQTARGFDKKTARKPLESLSGSR